MEGILDLSKELDVTLLDACVQTLLSGTPQQINRAQKVLTEFQSRTQAWKCVDRVLSQSKNSETKQIALSILDKAIQSRWNIFPQEQRTGIRTFIVNFIIEYSTTEEKLRASRKLVTKLNRTLVEILKQDWPHNWPNFISELVGSSRTSDAICENNMAILRLLSEEIFDFSKGSMTQAKAKKLKSSLNDEFVSVFELCQQILEKSEKTELIQETLQTLQNFLGWIPLGFIFETSLIDTLGGRFLPVPLFRNSALRCLTEIGALDTGEQYPDMFVKLFTGVMLQLKSILPIPAGNQELLTYMSKLLGQHCTPTEEQFVVNLTNFFASFFYTHLTLVESSYTTQAHVLEGHRYLISITNIDHKEVFKTCLDYWLWLTKNVWTSTGNRRDAYMQIFTWCRHTMIRRMVKPEEVIIVEDENGELVKEVMANVEAQQLYQTMREVLVFLTHLDCNDTSQIMSEKLAHKVERNDWTWHGLNTLCWAIGSVSGAMGEVDEKKFLVHVIRDLLGLCEITRGKDNKAVIASNIMYVVGQYPRFLKAHWRFLKTVVMKLFEFMHETFPGVQDMAVETMVKISRECRDQFVVVHEESTKPFVEEVLDNLDSRISQLSPTQIHVFYEAIGYAIEAAPTCGQQKWQELQENWLKRLMETPNSKWTSIINQAQQSLEYLSTAETLHDLANILKLNVRTCKAIGPRYIVQLQSMWINMLNIYKVYASLITSEVKTIGLSAPQCQHVKYMRIVKREILRLIQEFIQHTQEDGLDYVANNNNFMPPLLEAMLMDYKNSVPDARDAQVLSLLAVLLNKLQDRMLGSVGKILDCTLEVTLQMITRNFEDYPEHRINFFKLLQALNDHCFTAFLQAIQHSKVIIDTIVWALKHTESTISNTGLMILQSFLCKVEHSNVLGPFCQAYYLSILNDIFAVMTDTLHKPGFKLQSSIIQHLISMITATRMDNNLGKETALISISLTQDQTVKNEQYVQQYLLNLLSSFPNLDQHQIEQFIKGLFEFKDDHRLFKNHLRDFLSQLKEFSGQDNSALYDEELEAQIKKKKEEQKAVPGLVRPVPHDAVALNMME